MKHVKQIDISKSSLVSLKAELSRKQEEVLKAKAQAQAQFIHPIPRPKKQTLSIKTNAGVSERAEKDLEEAKEEVDLFKKSRAALEVKSKLYEKLSQDSSVITDDTKFLVNFQQKTSDKCNKIGETGTTKEHEEEKEEDNHFSDENYDSLDPEEDWVDYVDCLGRTRRCLRKDLAHVKARDVKLFESLGGYDDKNKATGDSNMRTVTVGEGEPELMSGDMKRELLRQKWEQQEEQLRNKTDIHYQDVLFDEARSHGVGYYGFSQDEAERRVQQDALSKLRQETQREQVAAQGLRERRQQQLQARLKAARQRKRTRLGLPPLEDDPETVVQAEEEAEPSESEKQETLDPDPKPEPAKRKLPQVRPWDIGKEGVKEVMSQEEWIEKKRSERPQDFAPPSSYQPDFAPNSAAVLPEKPKLTLFFSSKKSQNTFRNTGTKRSSIRDEKCGEYPTVCGREIDVQPSTSFYDISSPGDAKRPWGSKLNHRDVLDIKQDVSGKGAEIPPPATFEYYGPSFSGAGQSQSQHRMSDLESSITAGLKYLRQQAEQRERQQEKGLLDIV